MKHSHLGQPSQYIQTYSPHLLEPISRNFAREKITLPAQLPFHGIDQWNAFELSWLDPKGKPAIAMAEIEFPCDSPFLIESKSFKLYCNSFNGSPFPSWTEVEATMRRDLSQAVGAVVEIKLLPLNRVVPMFEKMPGTCLDHLDVSTDVYRVEPAFLQTGKNEVQEMLYSDLFKSNCLATGQPDWGSIWIHYVGPQIDHEGLLKYFISFRNHQGFAEHCVEQIFQEITKRCQPKQLSVYARYTRRGGFDINPFRSNFEPFLRVHRQIRQ